MLAGGGKLVEKEGGRGGKVEVVGAVSSPRAAAYLPLDHHPATKRATNTYLPLSTYLLYLL